MDALEALVAAGDPAAHDRLRQLGPLTPPARSERFLGLAAAWALGEGRVPLARRLAPAAGEVARQARAATRLRLLYTAWRRAEALGLQTAAQARGRLLEPALAPALTPALARRLATSLRASGHEGQAAALLDPARDPDAARLLQSWLCG